MLRAIQLINWQNHASRTVHFDRNCTVLVGPNGSGKSAVIRALEWVSFNSWGGKADGFITWGRESATVRLWTDKHVIRRHKSSADNLYALDGVEIRFDSVNRRSVPEVVASAINLNADNFQGQLDSAFWFSLTPGEVVKALNRIVNLEEIDASLARAKSRLSDARARERLTSERLLTAQNLTKSLSWTLRSHKNLCTLEQYQTRIQAMSARIDAAETCTRAIRHAERVRVHALVIVAEGRAVLSLHQQAAALQQRANRVQTVLDRVASLDRRRASLAQLIASKREQYAELERQQVNVCPTCKRPL